VTSLEEEKALYRMNNCQQAHQQQEHARCQAMRSMGVAQATASVWPAKM
jgi:hypothetical protein